VSRKHDFLDEIIADRTRRNPDFPRLMEAALERRRLLRELAATRNRLGITQETVAARMETSQSAVARMERGDMNPKLSTIEGYASAIGRRVQWRIVPNGTVARPRRRKRAGPR
jgi:DNA-binding XRE family transcriptional regulator